MISYILSNNEQDIVYILSHSNYFLILNMLFTIFDNVFLFCRLETFRTAKLNGSSTVWLKINQCLSSRLRVKTDSVESHEKP